MSWVQSTILIKTKISNVKFFLAKFENFSWHSHCLQHAVVGGTSKIALCSMYLYFLEKQFYI